VLTFSSPEQGFFSDERSECVLLPALKFHTLLDVIRQVLCNTMDTGGRNSEGAACNIWKPATYGSLQHMEACKIWKPATYGTLSGDSAYRFT